jgi:hypothetical protein
VLNEEAVADQVFQPADEPEFKEHDRVKRGLTRVAVQHLGLRIEKVPVE